MKQKIRPFILMAFLLLIMRQPGEAQVKKRPAKNTNSAGQRLRKLFAEDPHIFEWSIRKDSNLSAYTLYRESIEIRDDSVLIKAHYNKKPMTYHHSYFIDYGSNEDNPVYVVRNRKSAYHLVGEQIWVRNAESRKTEKYKLMRAGYETGYGALIQMPGQKKYQRQGQVLHLAPKEK